MFSSRTLRAAIVGLGLVAGVGSLPTLLVADNPPPAQPAGSDPIEKFKITVDTLNLTADQKPKIESLFAAANDQVRKMPKIDDPKEQRKAVLAVLDKLRKNVMEVLTEDQNTALVKETLGLQVNKLRARLHEPEMKLTADQTKKVDAILDDTMKKFVEISAQGRKTDTDPRPKIIEASKAMADQVLNVLDDNQKKMLSGK